MIAPAFPIVLVPDKWRVEFDQLQWLLQRAKGRAGDGRTGWRDTSFPTTLATLKREACRFLGDLTPEIEALLSRLPERHPFYGPGHR